MSAALRRVCGLAHATILATVVVWAGLAACLGLVLTPAAVAAGWTFQDSKTSATLWGVDFVDATHGWAVGDSGTILATTDAGATWTPQVSGVSVSLADVFFLNAGEGWAVGGSGTIRHTGNGGATWTLMTSGISNSLNGVAFIDSQHGWAVGDGGTMLMTVNGGTTWVPQTVVSSAVDLEDIAFAPGGSLGYAVGTSSLVRIVPGSPPSYTVFPTSYTMQNVALVDTGHAFAVGSGGTFLSTASAASGGPWTRSTYGFGLAPIYGLACVDAAHLWLSGLGAFGSGDIWASRDGGATWDIQGAVVAGTKPFYAIDFVDAAHGWVVGQEGVVFTSSNGGFAAPRILEFSPTSGPHGTQVTITGQDFVDVTRVAFNDTSAQYTVADAGTISATVPAGATTGQVTVTTLSGSDISTGDFKVTSAVAKPKLSKLSPTKGRVGCLVTLSGSSFGKKRGKSCVKFGARTATRYVSWSATKIKVRVPKGTRKGSVKVVVKTNGGTSGGKRFTRK